MTGALVEGSWREAARSAPAASASLYVSAVRRLDALVFDGESENIRVLLGGAGEKAGAYRLAASELDRFLLQRPAFAWAHALKGKALLNAGAAAECRAALDAALKLEPGLAQGYVWRAQAALLCGDAPAALADLKRHDAMAGGGYWSHFLRGVALSFQGKGAEAAKAWKKTLRWAPGSVASRAMLGLGAAGRGKTREASRLLAGAAKSGGKDAGYVLALKGLVERQMGDLEGSRASLDRAIQALPSPWMFSHRADVLNRMGFYREALKDLKRLSELAPSQPQAYVQAANVLFDQAFYEAALKAMDAALARSPDDGALHARKARMLWVAGRTEDAWAAAEQARRLAPHDGQVSAEWAQLAAVSGREDRAREELVRNGWKGNPLKDLYLGLAASRKGDRPKARRFFMAAKKIAERRGDGALAERAGFYALVSRLLSRPHPPSGPMGATGLYLVSVGIRHPYQTTVEAVRALAACSEIYNNVPDPQIAEFLSLFPGKVIAVPREPGKLPEDRARWILSRAAAGEAAGFVTRIHPFIYRRIGYDLARLAPGFGVPLRACGAFSLTESALVRSERALRVFDLGWLTRRLALLDPPPRSASRCAPRSGAAIPSATRPSCWAAPGTARPPPRASRCTASRRPCATATAAACCTCRGRGNHEASRIPRSEL